MTPQEFLEQHLAAPDLRVIDTAIKLVQSGRQMFSCTALTLAVYNAVPRRCFHTGGTAALRRVVALYRAQYEEVVRHQNAGRLPEFWNRADTSANRAARIRALENFRAACIAAANKE